RRLEHGGGPLAEGLLHPAHKARAQLRCLGRRKKRAPLGRVAAEVVEELLAGGAALDVALDRRALAIVELLAQQPLELFASGTGVHDDSSEGLGADVSSLRTSSFSSLWTLLLATNTVATFKPSLWAASAPDRPSTASRRKASQVWGCTRSRTRIIACSKSSRSNSCSRCLTRSSRASIASSRWRTAVSPLPSPARWRSCKKSLQAWCATVRSQPRK